MNEGLSRRLGRLDKQLRRLEDRLAPPKQSEAVRLLFEDLEVSRARVNAARVSEGQEPLPDRPPTVYPPGHRFTVYDVMAELHEGRARVAAAKRKRDAEGQETTLHAEAL